MIIAAIFSDFFFCFSYLFTYVQIVPNHVHLTFLPCPLSIAFLLVFDFTFIFFFLSYVLASPCSTSSMPPIPTLSSLFHPPDHCLAVATPDRPMPPEPLSSDCRLAHRKGQLAQLPKHFGGVQYALLWTLLTMPPTDDNIGLVAETA